jgi:phosphate transport system permease protein
MSVQNLTRTPVRAAAAQRASGARVTSLSARGEPFMWCLGGALALGILMIVGFLLLVLWNGVVTFWPKPISLVTLANGDTIAGEAVRDELFRPDGAALARLEPAERARIERSEGFASRTLYRTGNYDLYNEDFVWIPDFNVKSVETPRDLVLVERLEWGVFIGRIAALTLDGTAADMRALSAGELDRRHAEARARRARLRAIEHDQIGEVNRELDHERLKLRRTLLSAGESSPAFAQATARLQEREAALKQEYDRLAAMAAELKQRDERDTITLADVNGREKVLPLSTVVRYYRANELGWAARLGTYLSRWAEFLTDEPREANTEGGIMPAIFGTVAMTLLLVVVVAPFGVVTALYLREYARQGRLVSIVRISVNNLAGVPSIVYGVFGLGFFAYLLGGTIDQIFYAERLPNPTFGTGGLLWSSLTLALLTVPVVIVATEEALAAVPRSMREGSLACGASKWQTIRYVVLPRAMPGIMTGIILAMARGAGEVAPLMLVGVVKLAPELPLDGTFPFLHLERSFMHLGFHIYDVGFQSRNSEAGKPMVFVTTLLLILLIAVMNASAIYIRNRLKRKFAGSQF